jgi:hypothetical protein
MEAEASLFVKEFLKRAHLDNHDHDWKMMIRPAVKHAPRPYRGLYHPHP